MSERFITTQCAKCRTMGCITCAAHSASQDTPTHLPVLVVVGGYGSVIHEGGASGHAALGCIGLPGAPNHDGVSVHSDAKAKLQQRRGRQ
jgi:hypothetical protein